MPDLIFDDASLRAQDLVSDRVGVIAEVRFPKLAADDLELHVVESLGATLSTLGPNLARGAGASIDSARALMKAIGESIERYCSGFYDQGALLLSTQQALAADAVPTEDFALFSNDQYLKPRFPYAPLTPETAVRWAQGYSLVSDRPIYVPAAYVYIPYAYDIPHEPVFRDLISTGLACGADTTSAIYKGILENVERDAFMIVWQNRLPRPGIDLRCIKDPFVQRFLRVTDDANLNCSAVMLTLDIAVPVILVVLTTRSSRPPLTVVGLGADLDPHRALVDALEEAGLSFWGMRRAVAAAQRQPGRRYQDATGLHEHGLAHALIPELRSAMEFLIEPETIVSREYLRKPFHGDAVAKLETLVEQFRAMALDIIVFDLTTPDVDDLGFKVVRVVVPGLQPLDTNHKYQHLGGRRLYEVPERLGLGRQNSEYEMNPCPHPFP